MTEEQSLRLYELRAIGSKMRSPEDQAEYRKLYKLEANAKNYAKHREAHCQRKRKWRLDNPIAYMLHFARQSATKRGIAFSLTVDDLPACLPIHCPVLGIELVYGPAIDDAKLTQGRPNAASLDRIDSSRGYEAGNVQVISWRANRLKADGTLAEFQAIVEYLQGQPR